MWIRINGSLVCTELPVMRQLATIGAKIELTVNDPFPTFLMEYNDHLWLFNATGGKVDTMAGSLSAIKFNHIADIRTLIPELDWKEVNVNQGSVLPTAWSESDDSALNNIIETLVNCRDGFMSREIKESYNKDIAFLNSLKERLQKS